MSFNFGVDTPPGIYTGIWINWSHGRIFGSTLTLDRKSGALLIAFLALFVSFVGSRVWRVACHGLHHICSSQHDQVGVYHQRQAILRNSDNATSALVRWTLLLIAYRQHSKRVFIRVLPFALFSAFAAAIFAAAGILSSRIATSTGQEVLVSSKQCGMNILGSYAAGGNSETPSIEKYQSFLTVLIPFLAQRMVLFFDYAQRCYIGSPSAQGCGVFVKPNLPSIVEKNASCPFENEMCRLQTGNIRIDTGYLNSQYDFGLNTPANERFLYRRITQCAPIVSDGYKRRTTFTTPQSETTYVQYLYGTSQNETNVTYLYPHLPKAQADFNVIYTGSQGYVLRYHYTNVLNGSIAEDHSFVPIDGLLRTDADVILIFLSANQEVYPEPVNDAWYSAHQLTIPFNFPFAPWNDLTIEGRFADEPVSTLGCTKQYQICYPDLHGDPKYCSRLGGRNELDYLAASIQANERQRSLAEWAIRAVLMGKELEYFIQALGASALTSRSSIIGGFQTPVRDDQWQIDVQNWHAAALAGIQGSAVGAATGPDTEAMQQFWQPPQTEIEQYVCKNQKAISSAHVNFNVLGLALVLSIGSVMVAISILLSPVTTLMQKRKKRYTYAHLEWCSNGTLQLQRLAHESSLQRKMWTGCLGQVPACLENEALAELDVSIPHHPTLKRMAPCADVKSVSVSSEECSKTSLVEVEEKEISGS